MKRIYEFLITARFAGLSLLSFCLFGSPVVSQGGTIFQDSFESRNLFLTRNGFAWQPRNSYVDPVISGSNKASGSYSLEFSYLEEGVAPDSPDSWKDLRFSLGDTYQEIWLKFNLYIPANYVHREEAVPNNKFLYLDNAEDLSVGFESWPCSLAPSDPVCVDQGSGSDYIPLHLKWGGVDRGHDHPGNNYFGQISDPATYVNTNADLGKWHEWIVHIKLASSADSADGVVEIWKNGVKQMEYLRLENYAARGLIQGQILGWANSGYASQTDIYVDDFVVSTTPISPGVAVGVSAPKVPKNLQIK